MIDEGHERQVTLSPQRIERVRCAVGALLAALDAAARDDAARQGDDAAELYDAALTMVMRLVYLPVAARHDLLAGRAGVAAASLASLASLHSQLGASAAADGRAALARRYDAWCRLLTILHIVHRVREGQPPFRDRAPGPEADHATREGWVGLPAGGIDPRGGGPDPLLVAGLSTHARPHLLHITNDTVLDLLEGVLDAGSGDALDEPPEGDGSGAIQGVGVLYQHLRDDSAVRATEPLLGVAARAGRAPFLPLRQLEAERAAGDAALLVYLRRATGRAMTALAADLAGSGVARRGAPPRGDGNLLAACGGDADLCRRARPFARLLRADVAGCPVVVPGGRVYIKRGRRASGLHYTPPSVAATVVRHALDQVAYEGAAYDLPRAQWRLRSAAELLELKICDMAMGCGVLLVESCRYLAARLTEAWSLAEHGRPGAHIDAAGRPVEQDVVAWAIPQEPAARLALARRLVAGRCLYGVDKDPIAVELARLALRATGDGRRATGERATGEDAGVAWLVVSGRFTDQLSVLDQRLRVGDALVGTPIAHRPSPIAHRPFDWPRAFPEVFARGRDRAGFDAIVGNPPFGNGIEGATARDSAFKRYAAAHYAPFAYGAGDYCLLFWGRALLHLLAPGGAYGWLSPTALLSDLKPWQAWAHAHARPTTLILYPADLFPGARIRTTAYCGRLGQSSRVTIVDYDTGGAPAVIGLSRPPQRATGTGGATALPESPPDLCQALEAGEPLPVTRPWPSTLACWYEATRCPDVAPRAPSRHERPAIAAARPDMVTLADLPVRLHAGCATAAAYELAPLVADDIGGHGARLVTTGALDRYACAWGQAPIRYLHRTYHHPRWPAHSVAPAAVARALERQRGPKILVGGLTAVLECWLDERGDAAGVVSTWVVAPGEGVTLDGLYLLLAVLNSATFSRLYMGRYGARSMSGRQTTIYKQALRAMPCPRVVGPAMLSSMQEWRGPLHLDTTAGLLAVCGHSGRVLQGMPGVDVPSADKSPGSAGILPVPVTRTGRAGCPRSQGALGPVPVDDKLIGEPWRRALDRLGHLAVGLLYGRGEDGAEDDYAWWCDRMGVVPDDASPHDLVDLLGVVS